MDQIKELQKLKRLEILQEIDKGARNLEWFHDEAPQMKDEDRKQATKDLLRIGLIENIEEYPHQHPRPFRLTAQGQSFLKDVLGQIGVDGKIDWYRVNEIEFPSIP